MSRTVSVRAAIDIEQTPRSFHAHAVPDGIAIRPGDAVIVHGVPTDLPFGTRLVAECDATVRRAGPWRRFWCRATSLFHVTELYEVGFEPLGPVLVTHVPAGPGQGRPA